MTRLIALGNVLFMDAQRGEDSSRVIKALGGSTAAYVYIVGFAVLCVVNLEACLLVLVAEFNGVENSWMMSYNWVNIADSSEPYQWYSAVYAAIASNTNTGLAGMKWLSYQEFGVCMLMQLVGMVMLTMVLTVGISSITRLTGTARRAHLLTLKLKRVRAWLRCQQLPDRMSKHIMNTNTGLAGMKWLSYQEFGVCMLMQLVGMVMLTMVLTVGISSITRLTGTARRAHLLTLKLKRVRAWLRCQQLPDRMSKHIMSFYYEVWVKQARPVCEDAVVADMPHFLRGSLLLPMTLHLVERVHYFSECDPLLRSLLAQSLVPIEVMGGVELCEEGHEPDCCWLLESGTLMALNTKGQQYLLTAPCLIGECVILRQAVPACSKRLWSYRTLMADEEAVPCKLWRLQARDITVLSSCYPALGKLVYKLCRSSCALHAFPGADAAWCELADRVAPSLLALPEGIQDSTRAQLGKAGVEDGSLQLLLDALVEVAVLNPKDALALSGALAHPDKASG
ncbi:cyclic nucleotide-binding domain-containing protein [Haematococcus lacustris]|uniref:Cyclic nucleotide-binding domain-containing protein n=1 Tax=Haematococcus lacustris TaxID=44745 RepID=A0A699YT23_HAELA|nr:cyclic nucleotide-binding domain-containing protein [Haematococcus lacustris]